MSLFMVHKCCCNTPRNKQDIKAIKDSRNHLLHDKFQKVNKINKHFVEAGIKLVDKIRKKSSYKYIR